MSDTVRLPEMEAADPIEAIPSRSNVLMVVTPRGRWITSDAAGRGRLFRGAVEHDGRDGRGS